MNNAHLVFVVIVGACFGAFLEKGRVFEPLIIREQMKWTNFLMLKMFLSAGMCSLISLTIIGLVAKDKLEATRSLSKLPSTLRTVVGCALLGSGMALSGACPGTILAQIGSGVTSSLFALTGGYV